MKKTSQCFFSLSVRPYAPLEICKRVSERSSYSKGELEGCIGEFLIEIVNVIEEGNIVQIGVLGNFRMSLKTILPTDIEKEFNVSCIGSGKVLFHPGKDPLPDDGGGSQLSTGIQIIFKL